MAFSSLVIELDVMVKRRSEVKMTTNNLMRRLLKERNDVCFTPHRPLKGEAMRRSSIISDRRA